MSEKKPFVLRQYQQDAVDDMDARIVFGSDNLVLRAVTSFGKAGVIAKMAENYASQGVMIIVNITALIDQIAEHLDHFNVDYSVLKAGRKNDFDPSKKVQLVMAQTLYARIKDVKFDHEFYLWQQDESHKEWSTNRTSAILEVIKPSVKIGYTATPWTADGYALSGAELVETVTDDYLTGEGFLSPIKYYIPRWAEKIDYSKVKMTAGEYNMSELDNIIGSESYIRNMIRSMDQRDIKKKNKKFLVFTTTTDMADKISRYLRQAGYSVEAYHSKIHKKTLENRMESFKNNAPYIGPHQEDKSLFYIEPEDRPPLKGLVSVSKIAVGFSVSDIDVGVIARAVGSMNLWPQLVGRMKRIHKGKTHAEILDLGKNISRNGFPEDPYTPPEKTGMKDMDKISLTEAKDHLSMDHMVAAIQSDVPEEMTREKYQLVLDEITRNKTKLTAMTTRQLSDKLEITQEPLEMIAILAVLFDQIHCHDVEDKWGRPTRGYLAKNGKTVSGFLNPNSIEWMAELWIEALPKETEYYRKKYIKALRTRSKNLLKEAGSIWAIRFFIEFLLGEDELEKQIITQSEEAQAEPFKIVYENNAGEEIGYEIEDDEIPF